MGTNYIDVNITNEDSEAPTQDISGVHIWLILIKAFHSLDACTARNLRDNGLGDSDFRVLEILLHKGPLPVNFMGPKVFLTPGSISTAIDRLHKRGLVSRTGSKTDRRVHMVDLTKKGRDLIDRAFSKHAGQMEKLASVLTASERVQLVHALKKIGKHAAESPKVADRRDLR